MIKKYIENFNSLRIARTIDINDVNIENILVSNNYHIKKRLSTFLVIKIFLMMI